MAKSLVDIEFDKVMFAVENSDFRSTEKRFGYDTISSMLQLFKQALEIKEFKAASNVLGFLSTTLELMYNDIYHKNISDGYDNWYYENSITMSALKSIVLSDNIAGLSAYTEHYRIGQALRCSISDEVKRRFTVMQTIVESYIALIDIDKDLLPSGRY